MPHLPPELVLKIIHYLRGDLRSLSACSLMSQCWIDVSRNLLFRRLRVSQGPVTGSSPPFSDLLKFLISAPSIAKLIYSLTLQGTESSSHIYAERFLVILEALPNVEDVSLVALSIGITKDCLSRLGTVPRSRALQRFTLEDINVVGSCHLSVICHFLQPFRSIQHITLGKIRTEFDRYDARKTLDTLGSVTVPSDLEINSLKIDMRYHASLLFLEICRVTREASLHEFVLNGLGNTTIVSNSNAIPRFILDIGPQFQRLGLAMGRKMRFTSLDLSTCSNLQSLNFEFKGPFDDPLDLCVRFRSSLAALRTTSRVPFHLSYEFSPPYDIKKFGKMLTSKIIPWEALQDFYLSRPCSHNKLSIQLHASVDSGVAEDLEIRLIFLLPELASRDLLHVTRREELT